MNKFTNSRTQPLHKFHSQNYNTNVVPLITRYAKLDKDSLDEIKEQEPVEEFKEQEPVEEFKEQEPVEELKEQAKEQNEEQIGESIEGIYHSNESFREEKPSSPEIIAKVLDKTKLYSLIKLKKW